MVRALGGEENPQAPAAIQIALIWSWGRGELEGLLCRGSGYENSVFMKWRHPIGGRLVSRIEAGFKGAGTPFCRWGLGRAKSHRLVHKGSMPLMRQSARGMQRESAAQAKQSPLPRCVVLPHTSCN